MKFKKGMKIRISSDNENYRGYIHKTWIIEKISYSREDHPGYDEGIGGALIDCKGLPFSLHEFEFNII